MLHSLLLGKRLQFAPYLTILMHSEWWLVVTVVAEPYLETVLFGLGSERPTEYVMPFKPLPGVTDEASVCVLLNDAISHLSSPP